MTSLAFERCNAKGREAEERIFLIFGRAGWEVQWKYAGAKRDLWAKGPNGPELIEVKNEDNFADGGRICIELWQGLSSRKPSGLRTSEATVYVHTVADRYVAYRTQAMRNYIDRGLINGLLQEKSFGKSDNGNGGVLVERLLRIGKDWFDEGDIEALPKSKVFEVSAVRS